MVTGKPQKPSLVTRIVIYPIIGVFFAVLLSVVFILANGYRFTYTNGKVGLLKTGMIIVATRPFDAGISINGKTYKDRTSFYLLPTKITNLDPKTYKVEISKTGYRTWKNSLVVSPNLVTWANYILLFADKLNIVKVNVPVGKVVARSDNGRHILFSGATDKYGLKALDANNLSQKDFWPTATPSETWLVSPQISRAEFSPSNDRVLVRVVNGTRTEFVIADATASQVKLIHLNSTLSHDFDDAYWSRTNNNEIYLLSKGQLYLVNVNDSSFGSPILSDTVAASVDESNQILYVTKTQTGTYSAGKMNLDGSNKTTLVSSVLSSKTFKLGYSSQNNIFTLLSSDTGELTAYYVGNTGKKYSIKLSDGVTSFGWSSDGQKLFYWGKNFVKRYDWESGKEVDVLISDTPTDINWFFDDNHYLVTNSKGIYEMDFDGTNVVPISDTPVANFDFDKGNNNIIFATIDVSGAETFSKYISEF